MATKAQQVEEAQREQQQLGQGSTQGGTGPVLPGYVEPPPTYTAPPPGYTQIQPAQPGQFGQPTVVIQPAARPVVPCFTEVPMRMTCPKCHQEICTATSYESGTMTFVTAGIMILIGLWLGCCLIPFCLDQCKDVVHNCPNCKYYLGRYNRI